MNASKSQIDASQRDDYAAARPANLKTDNMPKNRHKVSNPVRAARLVRARAVFTYSQVAFGGPGAQGTGPPMPPKERKRATIVREGTSAILKFEQIKGLAAQWELEPSH